MATLLILDSQVLNELLKNSFIIGRLINEGCISVDNLLLLNSDEIKALVSTSQEVLEDKEENSLFYNFSSSDSRSFPKGSNSGSSTSDYSGPLV